MNEQIRDLLEAKYRQYCKPEFLHSDPIQIPHRFSLKQDVEIAGFIAATFAWGQRKTILNKAQEFVLLMDNAPYQYITSAQQSDIKPFKKFVHRTFNGEDAQGLILALQKIYAQHQSLESVFISSQNQINYLAGIENLRNSLIVNGLPPRTWRHIPSPASGSAAKRLVMFLRWMVRPASEGVDFGLWTHLSPALLSCPLDVHSGRVARALGLLNRQANDWRAVEELDANLRQLSPEDPAKYDFALFGLGVFEGFQ